MSEARGLGLLRFGVRIGSGAGYVI